MKNRRLISTMLFSIVLVCTAMCLANARQHAKATSRNQLRTPEYLAMRAKSDALFKEAYHAWRVEKNLPKAELLFRRQLEVEPDDPFALRAIAQVLEVQGKTSEATEYYEKLVYPRDGSGSTFSGDPGTLISYATLLDAEGKRTEATRVYEKAVSENVSISSNYPPLSATEASPERTRALAYVAKGMTDMGAGRYEQAEEWLGKAVRLQPRLGIAQFYYGKSLEKLKKNKEAGVAYENAVRCSGTDRDLSSAAKLALGNSH